MRDNDSTTLWRTILHQLDPHADLRQAQLKIQPVAGGCINQTMRLSCQGRDYFIKLNAAHRLGMFEAEQEGLEQLAATQTIQVPAVLACGLADAQAYLVLEYLHLGSRGDEETAGRQLAELHRHSAPHFGWHRDNTLGSTTQVNKQEDDWIRFWRQKRLGYQLDQAEAKGYGGALQSQGRRLLEALPALLDHTPKASLLHGDLWSGNLAYDLNLKPVIFDPAVYFGDREADLAMTELFGGFSQRFYDAYQESWPLPPGYSLRKQLYNLYHILNHLNLFGGGYRQQALGMIQRLLSETG